MGELPVALANDTILECVIELRFSSAHPSVEELLPGLVFGKLGKHFVTVETMPAGTVPRSVRESNEQMRWLPTRVLKGPNLQMLFGPRAAAVSIPKPYPGWAKTKPLVMECLTTVLGTGITGVPERVAIKYVNLLQQGTSDHDLSQTNVKLELGDFPIRGVGTAVRAEIQHNGCVSIVEIVANAKVQGPDQTGVLLTIDTVRPTSEVELPANLPQVLEAIHSTEKEIFFGLISPATLSKLGPTYQTKH